MSNKRSRVGTAADRAAKATDEARTALDEIRESIAADKARRREELGETGGQLIARGVPEWTVRVHSRLGHVGGFAVFAALVVVGWPAAIMLVTTLVRIFGVNMVTRLPSTVLGDLNVPVELAASTTDRFLFSWVMPVLFFVLILAGLTLYVVIKLFRWGLIWTKLLALGLFAGYGVGVIADRRIRRAAKISRDSYAAASKRS